MLSKMHRFYLSYGFLNNTILCSPRKKQIKIQKSLHEQEIYAVKLLFLVAFNIILSYQRIGPIGTLNLAKWRHKRYLP